MPCASSSAPAPARAFGPDLVEVARALLKLHDERLELFGVACADQPWTILLDTFIAGETGQKLSITDACLPARVPATTALRWLRQFEEQGSLRRVPDPEDKRRSFILLTTDARDRLIRHLSSAATLLSSHASMLR